MAVDDFVSYCTLRARGSTSPLIEQGKVTTELVARAHQRRADLYLQSVPDSLAEQDIVTRWGRDVAAALVDVRSKASNWQIELAKVAYRWFNPKTQEATKLFWWNDLVRPLVGAGRRSAKDLPRLDLPPEIRQADLENYEASQPRQPSYTYYYGAIRDRQYTTLQYSFSYGYNDWATSFDGMNDHEGDWEGMYLSWAGILDLEKG